MFLIFVRISKIYLFFRVSAYNSRWLHVEVYKQPPNIIVKDCDRPNRRAQERRRHCQTYPNHNESDMSPHGSLSSLVKERQLLTHSWMFFHWTSVLSSYLLYVLVGHYQWKNNLGNSTKERTNHRKWNERILSRFDCARQNELGCSYSSIFI